jgi:hypothetical protein
MQAHIRTQLVERVGQEMRDRFVTFYESGALLDPNLPARLIVAVIQGEATGEIVSASDVRGQPTNYSDVLKD